MPAACGLIRPDAIPRESGPSDDSPTTFNACASPGLHAATPLQGGEEVRLLNLTPGGGAFAFAIPRVLLELEFRVKDRAPVIVAPHLDTVLVEPLAGAPVRSSPARKPIRPPTTRDWVRVT